MDRPNQTTTLLDWSSLPFSFVEVNPTTISGARDCTFADAKLELYAHSGRRIAIKSLLQN
ncbi:MAG: hypothetical protein ABSB81_00780 [Halobacteriota archaeon]